MKGTRRAEGGKVRIRVRQKTEWEVRKWKCWENRQGIELYSEGSEENGK